MPATTATTTATDPIRDLQRFLGINDSGTFDADTGAALWRAVRERRVAATDPIVIAARGAVAAGYAGNSPRESLAGAGPAVPPSTTGPLQDAPGGSIIIDGRAVPLPASVPLWVVQYRMGTLKMGKRSQRPCQVILHHDAADSAEACYRILNARKLSTHFAIDDNGCVLQFADPAKDRTWHAVGHIKAPGGDALNMGFSGRSIGIDISNPVIIDGPAGRRDHGRPMIADRVHGRPYKGLGCYPVQVDAALALLRLLAIHFPAIDVTQYRTDLEWPGTIEPHTPGIWGHLHINRGKVDPWGFPWHRLAELAPSPTKDEARAT